MTERLSGSVGVLEAFMSAALADDYAEQGPPRADARRGPAVPASLVTAVVAVAIGALVTILLVSTLRSADDRQRTREALVDRVAAAQTAVSDRQATVDAQQARVATLEADVLRAGKVAPGLAEQAAALATKAGTAGMAGDGVRITMDDAPGALAASENRVLDRDLQDVVNALWREGARGVAINGHRLVSTTAIRSAGEAIVVNYEPLDRPYRIEAVGALAAAARESGVGRLLTHLSRDYGLVTSSSSARVDLPAGELHQARYATPAPAGSPAS
jgi:uncharacterized protein YlxW (UPF0749 family)